MHAISAGGTFGRGSAFTSGRGKGCVVSGSASIFECGHDCMTYTTDGGEYDVATYSPDCPIHGWRWDYHGPARTLAWCREMDEARLRIAEPAGKPQPSDGPDYHAELAFWKERIRTNQ